MNKNLKYKNCEIDWIEPPMTSEKWTANVGSNDRSIYTKMGGQIKIIDGRTKEEMLAKAREYIDSLNVK
jgi:hypothetical protein